MNIRNRILEHRMKVALTSLLQFKDESKDAAEKQEDMAIDAVLTAEYAACLLEEMMGLE